MDFKSYFEELKRRKVIKTAIAYVAVAWIFVQIAADVLPIFEIPPFIQQTIIIILILGFPVILIFAWIYDVTPDGIRKTEKAHKIVPDGIQKTRRLNTVIISLLSIVVLLLLYDQFDQPDRDLQKQQLNGIYEDSIQNSIAVLPFKNWSGDNNLEYISDGLSDEITTNLQEVDALDKVVAFREALKFKYSDLGLQQISDSLGVRYILDGSMSLSGNLIRVKVQLVDGRTNDYFWGEDFTTSWDSNELFALQSEVTRRVIEKVKSGIGNSQELYNNVLPTENSEAYKYYLKGLYQHRKGSKQGIAQSIEYFKKAIELDSNYLGAYKQLSNAYRDSGLFDGVNNQREAWKYSKEYLEKVLKLSTDESDLRWAKNRIRNNSYFFDWNFDIMENEYLTGFDDRSYLMKTLYELNTGRYLEALQTASSRAENYPTCGVCQAYMANSLFFLGRTAEVKKVLDQNFELFNDNYRFLREAAALYYYLGDYEMSQEALKHIKFTFKDDSPSTLFLVAVNHQINGDSSPEKETVNGLVKQYEGQYSGSPAWHLAKYYAHVGDYEKTITWLQKSFNRHDVEMIWLRSEPLFAPIRNDLRYLQIYKEVGFPVPPELVPEGVPKMIR